MGGQEISVVPIQGPNDVGVFTQIVSDSFQPSASSLSLSISTTCTSGSLNRHLLDDVSIEEVV